MQHCVIFKRCVEINEEDAFSKLPSMESPKTLKLSKRQILLLMDSVLLFSHIPGSVFCVSSMLDSKGLHRFVFFFFQFFLCCIHGARLHVRPSRLNVREIGSSLDLVIFLQKKTPERLLRPPPGTLFLLNETPSAKANGLPLTTAFILIILTTEPCSLASSLRDKKKT